MRSRASRRCSSRSIPTSMEASLRQRIASNASAQLRISWKSSRGSTLPVSSELRCREGRRRAIGTGGRRRHQPRALACATTHAVLCAASSWAQASATHAAQTLITSTPAPDHSLTNARGRVSPRHIHHPSAATNPLSALDALSHQATRAGTADTVARGATHGMRLGQTSRRRRSVWGLENDPLPDPLVLPAEL